MGSYLILHPGSEFVELLLIVLAFSINILKNLLNLKMFLFVLLKFLFLN